MNRRMLRWAWIAADFGIPVGIAAGWLTVSTAERYGLGPAATWLGIAALVGAVPVCASIGMMAGYFTQADHRP